MPSLPARQASPDSCVMAPLLRLQCLTVPCVQGEGPQGCGALSPGSLPHAVQGAGEGHGQAGHRQRQAPPCRGEGPAAAQGPLGAGRCPAGCTSTAGSLVASNMSLALMVCGSRPAPCWSWQHEQGALGCMPQDWQSRHCKPDILLLVCSPSCLSSGCWRIPPSRRLCWHTSQIPPCVTGCAIGGATCQRLGRTSAWPGGSSWRGKQTRLASSGASAAGFTNAYFAQHLGCRRPDSSTSVVQPGRTSRTCAGQGCRLVQANPSCAARFQRQSAQDKES